MQKKYFRKAKYKNPFFNKKKNFLYLDLNFKTKIYIILILIIIGWLIYLLFFSQYFLIKKIQIETDNPVLENNIQEIVSSQLAEKKFLFFRQNNILIFEIKKLKEDIQKRYLLENIEIEKVYFNTLKIKVSEKITALNWITQNRRFLVDFEGKVIREIPQFIKKLSIPENTSSINTNSQTPQQNIGSKGETSNGGEIDDTVSSDTLEPTKDENRSYNNRDVKMEDEKIIVIYDLENKNVTIGEQILSKDQIQKIISIIEIFNKIVGVDILYFELNSSNIYDLVISTKEGWKVYMNITEDIDTQLDNLKLIFDEKFKQDRSSLEYIDLRFGEKVYYK